MGQLRLDVRKLKALIFVVMMGTCPSAARSDEAAIPEPQVLALPFPFYNEKFGGALGFVYGLNGFPEKQSRLIGTAFAGTNGAAMLFLAGLARSPVHRSRVLHRLF